MSLISDALDSLYETLHDSDIAGETVTLVVGEDTATILAVLETAPANAPQMQGLSPGQFDFAAASPKNIDHSFSILASDYAINSIPITPAQGHKIKRTFGGTTKTYQLMKSSSKGLVWEWQDGYDKRYLIHAKFISEE